MGGDAAKLVDNPLVNPTDEFLDQLAIFGPLEPERRGEVRQAVRGDHRLGLSRGRAGRPGEEAGAPRRRGCCSRPACSSCSSSSSSRSTRCSGCRCRPRRPGSRTRCSDWHWGNYSNAFSQYGDQFIRSFEYAALVDPARARHRVPARVRHRVPGRPVQERPARARGRAVLHQLPDPHARVEDDPGRPGGRRRAAPRRRDPRARTRHCCGPRSRSSAASPTTSCPSWCCRSTSRSRRSTPG